MTDPDAVAQAHHRACDFLQRGGRVTDKPDGFTTADLILLLERVREVHGMVAVHWYDVNNPPIE